MKILVPNIPNREIEVVADFMPIKEGYVVYHEVSMRDGHLGTILIRDNEGIVREFCRGCAQCI